MCNKFCFVNCVGMEDGLLNDMRWNLARTHGFNGSCWKDEWSTRLKVKFKVFRLLIEFWLKNQRLTIILQNRLIFILILIRRIINSNYNKAHNPCIMLPHTQNFLFSIIIITWSFIQNYKIRRNLEHRTNLRTNISKTRKYTIVSNLSELE